MTARGAAALLLAALASACSHATDLQPGLAATANRLRSEDALCNAPVQRTATQAVLCQEHAERKVFAERTPYLLNALGDFAAKRLTAAQWLDQKNHDATAAARRFDQTLAATLAALKAREPLLGDPLSPLRLRLAAAKPLDACPDQGSVRERVQCIAEHLTPIWRQEARDSLDEFNTASQTVLAAAGELDKSKAPQTYRQNASQYAAMIAQAKTELASALATALVAAQRRIDRATTLAPPDAAETSRAAQAAAPIAAAMEDAAVAAAPGYTALDTRQAPAPASPAAQGARDAARDVRQ